MSDSNAFSNAQPATIKRSGVGLDHPATSLIASEAFNIAAGEMAVVETGDEAVLVLTEDLIPASGEDVKSSLQPS